MTKYVVEFADRLTDAEAEVLPETWYHRSTHEGPNAEREAVKSAERFAKANRGASLKIRVRLSQDVILHTIVI